MPTAAGNQVGYFPLANGVDNRNVSVYGSAQFSTGGALTISHSNVAGITTGLSVADFSYIIQRRTNSSWTFTTNGLISNGASIGIRITGANLFTTSTNVIRLRLLLSSSVVGSYIPGSGTNPNLKAERNGLSSSNLSSTYYIGAADADLDPFNVAIATGNWSDGNIWSSGVAPGVTNNASIATGVIVTLDGNNVCKNLFINQGATLNASTNSLTVDNTLTVNGTMNISGGAVIINGGTTIGAGLSTNAGGSFTISSGSLTIGPAGGGNKRWTHSGGIVNINGGIININGNILITGGNFNQSNGNIYIDGNNGTSSATSVLNGSSLFQYNGGTIACNAGTITLIDPPYRTSISCLAVSLNNSVTNTSAFSGTHTFIFGDGISTTPGNTTNGFTIETYTSTTGGRTPLNNVIVNGGNITGRFVRNTLLPANGTHIKGTFTINSGSEYRLVTNTATRDCFGSNIINNGIMTTGGTITFGGETGIYIINTQQTISGAGIFQNLISGSTANFSGITLNNSGGISSTVGNISYSGTLTFASGNFNMGANTLIQVAGGNISGVPGTSNHIIGKFQQHAFTGSLNLNFPIGDAINYTPVLIIGGAGSVISAGEILVGTTSSEHPLINSSGIISVKDINRYYSIQSLNGISFVPASLTVLLNWVGGDLDGSANIFNFIVGKYDNANWTLPPVKNKTGISIRAYNLSELGEFVVGEPCLVSADFSYNGTPYCNTGTAIPTFNGGGIAGIFTEQTGLLTLNAITGVVNLFTSIPGTYFVTNSISTIGCAVVSITDTITVVGNAPAGIHIDAASNPTCSGMPVIFSATPTNGGATPFYQWKLNGTNVGTNSPTYTSTTLTTGKIISCVMTSGFSCATGSPATSNSINMTVRSNPATPTVTTIGSTTITCSGFVTLISSFHQSTGNLWTPGGIATDTNIISAGGSYSVIYTDTNGCSSLPSSPVVVTLNIPTSPLTGIYTIGSGAPTCTNFTSFANAMNALNTRGVNGNVTFNVSAGFSETAPPGGLQLKMCGLSSSLQSGIAQTITFQKTGTGTNPLIRSGTGTSNLDAIVSLIGTDYITFDGIDVTDTILNSNTTTQMEWGFALLKCDGTDGSQHNTIKNCGITLQKTNSSATGIYLNNHNEISNIAIAYSGAPGADSSFRSSFNTFYGNNISNVYTGISLTGSSLFNDTLNEIGQILKPVNSITNFGGGGNVVAGIVVSNQHKIKIKNNSINGGTGSTSTVAGITVVPFTGFSGDVSNNTITVTSASVSINSLSGINIPTITNGDNLNIQTNTIQGCSFSLGTSTPFLGIATSFSGSGIEIVSGNLVKNNNLTTPSFGTFYRN